MSAWKIRHVDLREDAEVGAAQEPQFLIFWWGPLPLGTRAFLAEELPLRRDQIATIAAELMADQIAARWAPDAIPLAGPDGRPQFAKRHEVVFDATSLAAEMDRLASPDAAPPSVSISVIVCTRDRPQPLGACLAALCAQRVAPAQILVIDNSSTRSAESVCLAFPQARYAHEPRPGLSIARNHGLRLASGALIAFTDDDVVVPANWTAELGRAFEAPQVDAMTGLVLPASLEDAAQRSFQFDMGGFGTRCVPVLFDSGFFMRNRVHGAQVWRIGAGANMAFRREVFERIGRFDERLGAGAAGCSEDSELWYRLLAAGGTCLYEPRAVVSHHHRDDWPALRRQMRAYMRGHVAALFVQYDRHGDAGNLRRIFGQLPRYFFRTAVDTLRNAAPERRSLLGQEILGWLLGLGYGLHPAWRRNRGGV